MMNRTRFTLKHRWADEKETFFSGRNGLHLSWWRNRKVRQMLPFVSIGDSFTLNKLKVIRVSEWEALVIHYS